MSIRSRRTNSLPFLIFPLVAMTSIAGVAPAQEAPPSADLVPVPVSDPVPAVTAISGSPVESVLSPAGEAVAPPTPPAAPATLESANEAVEAAADVVTALPNAVESIAAPAIAEPADPDALFRAGRYADARTAYAARAREQPDAVAPHWRAAVSAAAAGELVAAERHSAQVVRLALAATEAEYLAIAARAQLDRVVTPAPVSVSAVAAALAEGRHRTAAALVRLALAVRPVDDPERGRLYWLEGRAQLGAGRPEAAITAFETAAGFGLSAVELWLDLGDAWFARGDHGRARYYLALAAAVAPPGDRNAARAEARLTTLRGRSRTDRRR